MRTPDPGRSVSRRDFVAAAAGAVAAALLPRGMLGAAARARDFTELRRGVGTFVARGGTIGWLLNSTGGVVVDSQYPDTAAKLLEGIRERGRATLDALVSTHHHGDHTAGNPALRDHTRRIVAHRRAAELQYAAAAQMGSSAAPQAFPDTTFEREWTLQVGDETVRAKHYGPAHTSGDVTVFFERADVVHMGDLVFNRTYPFIDRASGASARGWVSLLETVSAEHGAGTLYIFGHGNPAHGVTGTRDDLLLQRDFLTALLEMAARALAEGRSREELLTVDRIPGFPDHIAPAARLTAGAALAAAYEEVSATGGA